MNFNLVFSVFCGVIVTACASPQNNYVAPSEQFSRPPLGEQVTVGVGEEMLSQGNLTYVDGLVVDTPISIGGYTFEGGFYPQSGDDENYTYHRFAYMNGGNENLGVLRKNFIVDPPSSIRAEKDGSQICVVTVFNLATCRERDFSRIQKSVSNNNAFQNTLLYSGRVGDKINVSYREYSGNMARPAYFNEVEYDLTESREIGYRGALIEIIEATNRSITYKVIRNFNTP